MVKTYKVEGMSCGGCASAVEQVIGVVLPHSQVTVELKEGLVMVEGVSDDSLIRQAVEDAGFTFAGTV
ncbi:MAG: heavy-metal-associated domain-containing protein [Gammaproteobacteria bacterium]|nr:heavy-metal-associated domain-containing protein [Gammaproteobacteria bacterium]